jgi:hypothetical protein
VVCLLIWDELMSSWSTYVQLNELTVANLKKILKSRGLADAGRKAELIERLTEALE